MNRPPASSARSHARPNPPLALRRSHPPLAPPFRHKAVLGVAGQVLDAIGTGKLSHIFLVGGCDGHEPQRSYYSRLAQVLPPTTWRARVPGGRGRCTAGFEQARKHAQNPSCPALRSQPSLTACSVFLPNRDLAPHLYSTLPLPTPSSLAPTYIHRNPHTLFRTPQVLPKDTLLLTWVAQGGAGFGRRA